MAQAPKKPQKSGGGGGLVGIILVTLIAAAGGGGFGFFLYQQFRGSPEEKRRRRFIPQPRRQAARRKMPSPHPQRHSLEPHRGQPVEPADAWLRVEATIVIEGMKEGADALALRVTEDLTAYLKTATLSQFEGPSGFQSLREDLVDRAKIRDGVHVKDLVIHGIVLE